MADFSLPFLLFQDEESREYALKQIKSMPQTSISEQFIENFLMVYFIYHPEHYPEAKEAFSHLTPFFTQNSFLQHFESFLNEFLNTLNRIIVLESQQRESDVNVMHPNQSNEMPEEIDPQLNDYYKIAEMDSYFYLNYDLDTEIESRSPQSSEGILINENLENLRTNRTYLYPISRNEFPNDTDEWEYEEIDENERDTRLDEEYQKLDSKIDKIYTLPNALISLASIEIIERMKVLILRNQSFKQFNLKYNTRLTKALCWIKNISNLFFLTLLQFKHVLSDYIANDFERDYIGTNPDFYFNLIYYSEIEDAANILNKYTNIILKEKKILQSPYSFLMYYKIIIKYKLKDLYPIISSDLKDALASNKFIWTYILIVSIISERSTVFFSELLDLYIFHDSPEIMNTFIYFISNFEDVLEILIYHEFKYKDDKKVLEKIQSLKNIISEHNRTMHDDNSMYIM